jgi:hypothetical protein
LSPDFSSSPSNGDGEVDLGEFKTILRAGAKQRQDAAEALAAAVEVVNKTNMKGEIASLEAAAAPLGAAIEVARAAGLVKEAKDANTRLKPLKKLLKKRAEVALCRVSK